MSLSDIHKNLGIPPNKQLFDTILVTENFATAEAAQECNITITDIHNIITMTLLLL